MRFILEGETPVDPPLVMFLDRDSKGNVALVCRESGGREWILVGITDEGEIIRYGSAPGHLGFQLEDGYIKVTDE